MTNVEETVGRVIEAMRENLGEELTLDDLARTAMFSKFHFSRMFQRVTGISPGRFLSAMRLQEAKRLLISTSSSVTEISHLVGYSSVGTFSSRFSNSVGISPSMYRRLGGFTSPVCSERKNLKRVAMIRGNVWPPSEGACGTIFVGLFPNRVPQGRPITCTILDHPGPYLLENVPLGSWYLLTHSIAADRHEVIRGARDTGLFVAAHGPMTIRHDTHIPPVDLRLKAKRSLDPPVLLALLDLRSAASREKAS